ncbi:MAG TPA: PadR family transcriptional regulator [Chloroflexota bacterium]|nr:PadR family transcriptional regulator [Chloroflexota bacterium]
MPAPVSATATGQAEPGDLRCRTLLRPAILLLLRDDASHGYELMRRLAELGVEVPATPGGLYRSLRAMADEGLVSSYWSTPERGPARRVYAITESGEQALQQSMSSLASLLQSVRGMLNRYRQRA